MQGLREYSVQFNASLDLLYRDIQLFRLGHCEVFFQFLKASFFMQQKLILLADFASVVFPADILVFFSCIQIRQKLS